MKTPPPSPRRRSYSPGLGRQLDPSWTWATVMSLPVACWDGGAAPSACRSGCRVCRCWEPASSPTSLRHKRVSRSVNHSVHTRADPGSDPGSDLSPTSRSDPGSDPGSAPGSDQGQSVDRSWTSAALSFSFSWLEDLLP